MYMHTNDNIYTAPLNLTKQIDPIWFRFRFRSLPKNIKYGIVVFREKQTTTSLGKNTKGTCIANM